MAVFDEATAEAGSAGARVLEKALDAVAEGRTAIVVAHRLTQAVAADRVVVLDRGRVVETGTHAALVAAGGHYAALWAAWSAVRQDPTARSEGRTAVRTQIEQARSAIRRIPLPSRSLMLKIHRWLSLGGPGLILIISLTGAVLVFGPRSLPGPDRSLFEATSGDKGAAAMIDRLRVRFTEEDAAVDHISFPVDTGRLLPAHEGQQRATANNWPRAAKIEVKTRSWLVYSTPARPGQRPRTGRPPASSTGASGGTTSSGRTRVSSGSPVTTWPASSPSPCSPSA